MRQFNFPANASTSKKWEYLQFCCKNNVPVIGYLTKFSDYFGFTVKVDDITGSLHKVDFSCSYINDYSLYVGKYVMLYVIKVNTVTHKLKLSRKRIALLKGEGDIVQGYIEEVYRNQLYVDAGFKVRLFLKNLPFIEDKNIESKYKVGDSIEIVLLEDIHRERYTSSSARTNDLWMAKRNGLNVGDILNVSIERVEEKGILVSISDFLESFINYNFLSDEYKKIFQKGKIVVGTRIKAAITGIDNEKKKIILSQKEVDCIIQKQAKELLKSQLERGDVVEAEIIDVNVKEAIMKIAGTEFKYSMKRQDLSPNKIINASDEVFIGQILQIVYLGESNGKIAFNRKCFVEDRYDEELYELSLAEILGKMNIGTTTFIGKAINIESKFFFTCIMSVAENGSDDNGKLLIDPITGKSLFAVINEELNSKIEVNSFYEFKIDLASKKYRKKSGTPFLFCVNSKVIRKVSDPYYDAVTLSFTKHRSPSSSTSLAYLLNEVGQNLYSSKKRMFFELIQNADDAASQNGVQIKLQIAGNYFVLTHDGYAFSKHDFDSITSAAKSTKGSNKKKTGYKGIGFKSVFTNSDTVQIKSGGFNFLFDKGLELYNDFRKFYFFVNDIENDPAEQQKFLHTYEKEFREFKDVRDIPWQLLPIWATNDSLEEDSIFNSSENVAIALKMAETTLAQYKEAIEEIFREPRFMLFLRNTKRVQLIQDGICKTIQKNISKQSNVVSLANSFNEKKRVENYYIFSSGEIIVGDNAFAEAGILLKRTERINSRGEKENFLVNLDENGNLLKTTIDVPDRIASSTETSISIALKLDELNVIVPIDKEDLSLYAYLPMNENRYKFPFYINADFIPKSDREGIQTDNPWNHFLFYQIGKNIVKMTSEIASVSQPNYLNLLPSKWITIESNETRMLAESFNRGYKEGLSEFAFIIDDQGNKTKADNIIYDKSGLSELIGHDSLYKLIGTDKRLPNEKIESSILIHDIFGVEYIKKESLKEKLLNNIDEVNAWLDSTSEEYRQNFYEWISENEDCHELIDKIHVFKFDDIWLSINEISIEKKQIVTTNAYLPILQILKELGFSCSSNTFEDHPLQEFLEEYIQEDKVLFSKILESDISFLPFEKRLLLFKTVALFKNVGEISLKTWKIFNNEENNTSKLSDMILYDESVPVWLNQFMLSKNESCEELEKYTIKTEDVYASIIVPHVDTILKEVDIYDIYQNYQESWQRSFTVTLIKNNTKNIISVVEKSDTSTKLEFIKNIDSLNIDSKKIYKPSDYLYRCLKIATNEDSLVTSIREKILIDKSPLSEFTIKDDFSISIGYNTYNFHLSNLIPDFKSSSKLAKVIKHFKDLPSIEKIFELKEIKDLHWVKNNLVEYLSLNESQLLNAEQFIFFMCFEKCQNKNYFESSITPYININDESVFLHILEHCLENDLGSVLRSYISLSNIHYPFEQLYGTYFHCEGYVLDSEKAPDFISEWADTQDKQDFLVSLGLHNLESDEMIRRQGFKNNSEKGNWTISNRDTIRRFLEWVRGSMILPFTDEFHVDILVPLLAKLGCGKSYNEETLSSSNEWNDERYQDWKTEHDLRIYVYDGKIPYSCSWDNSIFYEGAEKDYHYFADSKHLYINGQADAASVLASVYPIRGIFEKDDWHQLFFVSRDFITKYSDENESLRNKVAELEDIINQYRAAEHTGKEVTEKGKVGTNDQESINREVRIMAKPILKDNNYDVSEWDPITSPPDIIGIIKNPEGDPINVIVRSAKGRKIHLAATSFESLMSNPKNLLIVKGEDGEIHTVDFQELFGGNSNVNLIFDANFTPLSYFQALGTIFKYVKNTDFVIENPHYSAFDEIKGFGLDIKNDGVIILGAEEDI